MYVVVLTAVIHTVHLSFTRRRRCSWWWSSCTLGRSRWSAAPVVWIAPIALPQLQLQQWYDYYEDDDDYLCCPLEPWVVATACSRRTRRATRRLSHPVHDTCTEQPPMIIIIIIAIMISIIINTIVHGPLLETLEGRHGQTGYQPIHLHCSPHTWTGLHKERAQCLNPSGW